MRVFKVLLIGTVASAFTGCDPNPFNPLSPFSRVEEAADLPDSEAYDNSFDDSGSESTALPTVKILFNIPGEVKGSIEDAEKLLEEENARIAWGSEDSDATDVEDGGDFPNEVASAGLYRSIDLGVGHLNCLDEQLAADKVDYGLIKYTYSGFATESVDEQMTTVSSERVLPCVGNVEISFFEESDKAMAVTLSVTDGEGKSILVGHTEKQKISSAFDLDQDQIIPFVLDDPAGSKE